MWRGRPVKRLRRANTLGPINVELQSVINAGKTPGGREGLKARLSRGAGGGWDVRRGKLAESPPPAPPGGGAGGGGAGAPSTARSRTASPMDPVPCRPPGV